MSKQLLFSYGSIDVKVMDVKRLPRWILETSARTRNILETEDALSRILFASPFNMLDGIHKDYIRQQISKRDFSGFVKDKILQHMINN